MKIKNKEVRLLTDNGTEFDLMQDYYNFLEDNLFIVIPEMLQNEDFSTIRNYCWAYDRALRAIEFPSNIQKINAQALYGCYRLIEVKFSNQFPQDGFANASNIMASCTNLTTVYFPANSICTWVSGLLPTLAQARGLHLLVNENQLSTYKSTATWSDYKSRTFITPSHTQDLANEQWTQGCYDTTTGTFTSDVYHMCTNKFNIYDLDISYNSLSLFYGTGNVMDTAVVNPSILSIHFWDEGNNYLGRQDSKSTTGITGLEFIVPLGTYYIAFEMYYSGITLTNPAAPVAKVIDLLPWSNNALYESFLPITRLQEIYEDDSIWFTPLLSEVSSIGEKELFTIGSDGYNITFSTHLEGDTYVLLTSGSAPIYIDINSDTETEIKIDNKTLPQWMLSQGWGTINTIQSITPEGLKFLGLERNH